MMVDLLVQNQYFTEPIDRSGKTPLHYAAAHGLPDLIKEMLKRKDVNVNVKDLKGFTPLDLAVLNGQGDVVDAFFQSAYVDDVNIFSQAVHNVFSQAADAKYVAIVPLLFERLSRKLEKRIKSIDKGVVGGDTFSKEERYYLTSSALSMVFSHSGVLTVRGALGHLKAYKHLLQDGKLTTDEQQNVLYGLAYLQQYLLIEDYQAAEDILKDVTEDVKEKIQHLSRVHFAPKETRDTSSALSTSSSVVAPASAQHKMPGLHSDQKDNHPWEEGFCAGLSMEFARIFIEHPDQSIEKIMDKYDRKFEKNKDDPSKDAQLNPIHARVVRYQGFASCFLGGGEPFESGRVSDLLQGDDSSMIRIAVGSDQSGVWHDLLAGKRYNAEEECEEYFFWDSNAPDDERFICSDERELNSALTEHLSKHYRRFEECLSDNISDEEVALLASKKHAPLKGRAPPKLAQAGSPGPNPDLAPGL
jgi:hypothetical protein